MRWRWVATGCLLASFAVAGWALVFRTSDSQSAPPFKLAPLDEGPISQVVVANGTLQPVITVTVGSSVSGTVMQRLVDFNATVTKGQVLLKLDPTQFEARVRQAQGQLAAAQAKLAFAEGGAQRNQQLLDVGFISAPQRDQSVRELNAARGEVHAARANLDAMRTDLEATVIRAPVDGIVINRTVDVGQTVVSSFQSPDLYLIARNLREMVIHVSVSETDVGQIQEGQLARFRVDAFPTDEFEGRVSQLRLNATRSQGVVSYTAIVNVDNARGLLKPGMTAQARIVVANRPRVVRLPAASLRFKPEDGEVAPTSEQAATENDDGALSPRQGNARVFTVYTVGTDRALKPHKVTVGISNTRYAELLTGDLQPGDALVVRRIKPERPDQP